MRKTKYWLNFGLLLSLFLNSLPLMAQNKPSLQLLNTDDRAEIFRQFRKAGQNPAFSPALKKVAGSEAEDIETALEAQAVGFFELFAAATGREFKTLHEKAKALNQKAYEDQKKNPPQSKAKPKTLPRAIGKSYAGEDLFPNEFAAPPEARISTPLADEPQIQRTETEHGITLNGRETKTMDMADSTVTRTEGATANGGTDGKELFTDVIKTTTTTVASKTSNDKLEMTDKVAWGAGFALCPDAVGKLAGHARTLVSSTVVITKGNRIAAVTHEMKVEYKITGHVNDDAEFTHFTIEADGTETLTGNNRARDLGLMDDNGLSDGTGKFKYHSDNGKPPYETEADQYGIRHTVAPKIGDVALDAYAPLPGSSGLEEFLPNANGLALGEIQNLMLSTISNLKNGECVDVECVAAKNALKPGETIDVTATSVSKQDLGKFNAKLESSSAAPPKQVGTPSAVFRFTAESGGGGTFLVKSTSRRGIGLGMLQFAKEGVNDDEKDKCDGNWHGTVEVRRTFEDVTKEVTKPGDLPSNPRQSGWHEIINRQKYEGTIRIEDVKLATANVWVLNGAYSAHDDGYYLDHGAFTEPNECGWYVKKVINDESGLERKEPAFGEDTTDLTIQLIGSTYRGNAQIPELAGTFTSRTWHKPSGYCQDGNNKASDYNSTGAITANRMSINFEGKLDPANSDVLTGTATETSEDGKETTTITWTIKRCSPVRPKPKAPFKKK